MVYAMAKCKKPVERLWISSLEEGAIREGFAHLKPGKEYDSLYDAALCRQQADWLVGINGTRLFTVLYGGRVLKVGRVQTPTLAMLVEREERIQNFQKETYYIVSIQADGIAATSEPIKEKEKAEKVLEACQGKESVIRAIQK